MWPKAVAAQRLQSWLLVTALAALVLTSLLVLDLSRNLRTVVVSDTRRTQENALKELLSVPASASAEQLAKFSYETLRSYLDIEGGYLRNGEITGHSFPSYTEPGSQLRLPEIERKLVWAALRESEEKRQAATWVMPDGPDLLVVSVQVGTEKGFAAWTLRRLINFSDSSEFTRRLVLVGVMLLALAAIATVLALSFRLQRGFSDLQAGLARLRNEPNFRISPLGADLQPVVSAVNEMAESRERLEEELRREDRLRSMGRLVANIAHEIRNPLNSMRLTARLLARRLKGNDAALEPAEMIVEEIDRLEKLLRTLLALQPEEPPPLTVQSVVPIIERTLQLVAPHAKEQGIEIDCKPASKLEAAVDPASLQQALMNLLLNAIEASPTGGRVSVEISPSGIAIQDQGPGLSSEAMEHLCEPFFTTKPGGTGLGLAMTKSLLERMGAKLEAQNTEPGARFQIVFPKVDA